MGNSNERVYQGQFEISDNQFVVGKPVLLRGREKFNWRGALLGAVMTSVPIAVVATPFLFLPVSHPHPEPGLAVLGISLTAASMGFVAVGFE